jgi:hypothetical protein
MASIKWSGIVCVALFAWDTTAQVYSIGWHKLAGGGGTSLGGLYQISGTTGQAPRPESGGFCSGSAPRFPSAPLRKTAALMPPRIRACPSA